MRMKAQIFSLDMIFGLIVFILIIVGLISIFLFNFQAGSASEEALL